MIYATANAWAQDIQRKLNNVPFNLGPMANLIGTGAFACFAIAGIMLWLDQTRSAFAALAALVLAAVGLIMFACSILLRAAAPVYAPAKRPMELEHHAAE
jgi:hypothetical protein